VARESHRYGGFNILEKGRIICHRCIVVTRNSTTGDVGSSISYQRCCSVSTDVVASGASPEQSSGSCFASPRSLLVPEAVPAAKDG